MKRILFYLLAMFLLLWMLTCCTTIDPTVWISEHRKPIVCIPGPDEPVGKYKRWTLIDADGNVFFTQPLGIDLPDTIKPAKRGIEVKCDCVCLDSLKLNQ